ncbi:MAG TPA: hypothetical protein ENI27_09260, partial [bacterium]|nr:hypothetical protein [bacterium]
MSESRKPPTPKARPQLRKPPPSPKAATPATRTPLTKRFTVQEWTAENDGEKIVGYGDTGMGKTT